MEELEFLINMTYLVLTAGLCSIVFNKLRMPPIIGYLLAGILLVNVFTIPASSGQIISILSDIGLVMLMFCIGMELNLKKLKTDGRFAITVAITQIPLMMIIGYSAGVLLGCSSIAAIALGAIITGSSTAVLLAVLAMQDRIDRDTVNTLVLVTVIEDIGQVIIMSMITPIFAGGTTEPMDMVVMIVLIVVFMLGSILLGVRFIPRFLDWVGRNTSAEVLLVLSIGLCFGMAYLSVEIGMSMAIGAFLMGVILSQSEFEHEVRERVEPMKEVFMAIFFISIGMKVTIEGFIDNIGLAVVIFLVFVLAKVSTVFFGYFVGNRSYTEGFACAMSMAAMGEFAFIISEEAYRYSVIDSGFYTAVIGAALLSMTVMPAANKFTFRIVDYFACTPPKPLATAGELAYNIRADVYDKLNSDKIGKSIRRNLKNAYFCMFLMFVIEVLFIEYMSFCQEFFLKLVGVEYAAYLLFLLTNFFVLSVPTMYFVHSLKIVDVLLEESSAGLAGGLVGKKKEAFYRRVHLLGMPFLVAVIDFTILAIVPGPFGTVQSLVVIPIVVAIFLLGLAMNRRKYRKAVESESSPFEAESDADPEGSEADDGDEVPDGPQIQEGAHEESDPEGPPPAVENG